MAHVLLFHHAQGLTSGIEAFADDLRSAGHEVTAPDLYDGRTFATVEEGVAHAQHLGFADLVERGVAEAERLPTGLVYAGFSLGVMPAQRLAQQREGARGALFYHSAAPLEEFGGAWPGGLPLQMHVMVDDPFEDLPVMEELVGPTGGELYTYEGDAHLFTDRSLADHDPEAARQVMERTLAFLTEVDRGS